MDFRNLSRIADSSNPGSNIKTRVCDYVLDDGRFVVRAKHPNILIVENEDGSLEEIDFNALGISEGYDFTDFCKDHSIVIDYNDNDDDERLFDSVISTKAVKTLKKLKRRVLE